MTRPTTIVGTFGYLASSVERIAIACEATAAAAQPPPPSDADIRLAEVRAFVSGLPDSVGVIRNTILEIIDAPR